MTLSPRVCHGLAVLLLMLAPAAAISQTNPTLLGTWQAKEGPVTITLILSADGTGKLDDANIRYAVKDNVLAVTEDGTVNRYTFQLNGNKLTVVSQTQGTLTFTLTKKNHHHPNPAV